MSSSISIRNYGDLNILEQSNLTADSEVGAASISVENNQNFAIGRFVAIGTLGSEVCELREVQAVSDTTITFTQALKHSHEAYEPVTVLFGDKLRVYRSTSQTGEFTLLTTIDIDPDQTDTPYTDVSGSSSYWYKLAYYNSLTTSESDLNQSSAVQGNGYGDYVSVEYIRDAAGFKNNRFISDVDIDIHRQAAQARINGMLRSRFTVPFTTPVNPFIADVTKRLAAGYLWLDQYGQAYSEGSGTQGSNMVDSALEDLRSLQTGAMTLTDSEGGDNADNTGGGIGFDGWPNASTATTDVEEGGSERMFRIGRRY